MALWRLISIAASAALCICSAVHTNDSGYSSIVVFGDSFSDNGNGAWPLTNKTWPANPNYYGGRFSNGLVWVEYVANSLNLTLEDHAVGGATSSNALVQGYTGPNSTVPVPSVDEQVTNFLQNPPRNVSLSAPLFAIVGGVNDILFNLNISASQSFNALISSKEKLAAMYPNATFLFLSYPNVARLPYGFYVDAESKRVLSTWSRDLASLYRHKFLNHSGYVRTRTALFVDLLPLFADFDYYASPTKYGLAPLGDYGSCLTGAYGETNTTTLCNDPDQMVYWDEYHPTTHTHSLIAGLVLDVLKN